MKTQLIICVVLVLSCSCKNASRPSDAPARHNNVDIANHFIDVFYSFSTDSLASIVPVGSQPSILYYQKWAECGNYKIINRPGCIEKNDSLVLCPVTVKDDLIGALKVDFNVTDTFHLIITDGKIRFVTTTSNDPELYHQAKEWVKNNYPEVFEGPCQGIWEGGPTPCECVKAMVKGFKEFRNHLSRQAT